MYTLYGDGIHDDTLALQDLIDNAGCELTLPAPKKYYLISKPLSVPSHFSLVLPRFAEIRLAPGSDCYMLTNKLVPNPDFDPAKNCIFWDFIYRYRSDCPAENIEIRGGIWNFNNMEQSPNPLLQKDDPYAEYNGQAILFYNVKNLKVSDVTIKDPSSFGISLDTVSYFTMENITFDFNYGNPQCVCMDGIHVYGNCHHGFIHNLKGACRDDLVALNTDEGTPADITDITIDGIYAEECHSAVRLMAFLYNLKNVHITNVFGTYYQYCIALTAGALDSTYEAVNWQCEGYFDGITIDNVYASKAKRLPHLYPHQDSFVYPLIFVEPGMRVRNLAIRDIHRREYNVVIDTIMVNNNAEIDYMVIDNVSTENYTGEPIPLFRNRGFIKTLHVSNLRTDGDECIVNECEIKNLIEG